MPIRIQPDKMCNKLLHEELKKTKKIAQKLKTMKLVQIYLSFFLLQFLPVSLHFIFFYLNFLMWIHADPNPQPWSKCSNFFYYLGSDTSYDSESTVSIKCGIFLVPLYYMYCNRVHAPTFSAISDLEYIQYRMV